MRHFRTRWLHAPPQVACKNRARHSEKGKTSGFPGSQPANRLPERHELTTAEVSPMADTRERVHVERVGVVGVDRPAAEAFPLCNAEGERRWVAGHR